MSQLGNFGGVLPPAVPTTFRTTAGDAIPALNILTMTNGANITLSGAGSAITAALSGTTNHAIQLGNGTGSLSSLGVGATGTVLTGVTGADPAFSATPTVTTIYATTFDTNIAAAGVTMAGTTISADGTDVDININITAKGTGKVIIDDLQLTTDLAVTEGGTGASTLLDHGLIVGSGTAAVDTLAVGLTGTIVTGVTGADPTWTTATYPATVTKGDVLVASANNVIGVVGDVVNAGYVLTANAAAAPTFQALPAPVVGSFASDPETIAGTVANKAVAPSNLKAKLGTQTVHALPIGNSDSLALNWLAVGLNGQTLMGSTGADCGWTSSPQFGGSVTATNDINTTAGNLTASNGGVIVSNNAASTTDAQIEFRKTRTSGIITSGDGLGVTRFEGYDGVSFISGAKISSTNSGTVDVNRIAGDLKFFTHPDSVIALPSEPLLRMTIDSTGAITAPIVYSTAVGATAKVGLVDSTGLLGGLAGAANTIFVGGTKPSFTATPQCTDLTLTGKLQLAQCMSSTTGIIYGTRYNYGGTTTTTEPLIHTYGDTAGGINGFNLFIGMGAGNFTSTARINTVIGSAYIKSDNTLQGPGRSFTSAYGNNLIGYGCGDKITSGANNVCNGVGAGANLTTGSFNLMLGGSDAVTGGPGNYCVTGSSNIYLNNLGAAESNTIRIGSSSGNWQINSTFIAGIYGVTPAATLNVALINSSGQLGSAATLPASLGGKMAWTTATANVTPAVVNTGYLIKHATPATQLVVTLPTTSALYDEIEINGYTAGMWKLQSAAGLTIHFGSVDTTPGATGYLEATNKYDCVKIRCVVANAEWLVVSSVGTITVF
jgi:hypothetical protein